MTKKELRRQVKERLKEISPTRRFEAAIAAAERLVCSELWQSSKVVMLYAAMPAELDTFPLLEVAWKDGKSVCFPRIKEEKGQMEARFLTTINHLVANDYGIMEPDPNYCPLFELDQLNLIVVPGLAFDRERNRLGRGAGYYDNFLSIPQRSAPAVGYYFSCQEVDSIPVQEHDQPLDYIITEKELISF